MQAIGMSVGLLVFAALVCVLGAGLVAALFTPRELEDMGVITDGAAVSGGAVVRNQVATASRERVIEKIERLASKHSLLTLSTNDLRTLHTLELGMELVRIERMAEECDRRPHGVAGRSAEAAA